MILPGLVKKLWACAGPAYRLPPVAWRLCMGYTCALRMTRMVA